MIMKISSIAMVIRLCAGRTKLCRVPPLFADLNVTAVSPLSERDKTKLRATTAVVLSE